jgi:ADP-ribosyl-[dinitrogen reductase] hydrolase
MNYTWGAMLGLMVGDAAGATLEFHRESITEAIVDNAMRMPGGGALGVGPGQFTDDSELAISLACALHGKDPKQGFPKLQIATMYSKWFLSRPFDIGCTCARAFSSKPSEMEKSALLSQVSEANGALMRIAPLAIWCRNEPLEVIAAYAKHDALLSHPNQVCQDCNAIFCIAIAYLLNHPGDSNGAIQLLAKYVNDNITSKAKEWFLYDSLDIKSIDCSKNIGHVRWAFTLAIHCLRQSVPYEQGIKMTLLKGGDTDTNAAIVGALWGALHGADAIPDYMKNPVLSFDVCNPVQGYTRPPVFHISNVKNLKIYK